MADSDRQDGSDNRTPVYVLTGFLGSGKTTILSRFVRMPELSDTAVIVNEFGEIGLDHILISKGDENDVVLLDSGCLCCALNSSLGDTLTDLFHKRARGEIPAFSRVVIETTGLADPAPILHTLMTDRILARRYRLGAVLTVVDALNVEQQLPNYDEITKQIAIADRLILSKSDAADPKIFSRAKSLIAELNERAELLVSVHGDVSPNAALAPVSEFLSETRSPGDGRESEHHHHAELSSGITTFFFPVPLSVSWERYSAFVQYLQRNAGDKILRIKGLIRFEEETKPRVIQGVQHVFAPPQEISNDTTGDMGLVVIGRDIERADLERAFRVLTEDDAEPLQ